MRSVWFNTPNAICYIVSFLKLLAQWNEPFTSSALRCSLSRIPVRGGRERKIPPQHCVWAAGLALGLVMGWGRSAKRGRDGAMLYFDTCPFCCTSRCLWADTTRDYLLKSQGRHSCSSRAGVRGHSHKAHERGPPLRNLIAILGCSVLSFSIPERHQSCSLHLYSSATNLKLYKSVPSYQSHLWG